MQSTTAPPPTSSATSSATSPPISQPKVLPTTLDIPVKSEVTLPPSVRPTPPIPPTASQPQVQVSPSNVEITVTPSVTLPPAVGPTPPLGSSSDGGGTIYETPSPPSSASSGTADFGYGSIPRRRRGSESGKGNSGVTIVDGLQSISPIQAGVGVGHRREGNLVGGRNVEGWAGRSYVPVLADQGGSVEEEGGSLSGSDRVLLNRSRADLEKARLATSREFGRRELRDGLRDRYVLGCSSAFMISVVFVIVVSGMTTILANRNYPKLEVYSDWPDGGIIPAKYGCHAEDRKGGISFPLHWRNVPRQATNLAVLFAHPGAISLKGLDPVHWFITNIPLPEGDKDGSLVANASLNEELMPLGAVTHHNSMSMEGLYWPPCFDNGTSFFVVHVWAIEAEPVIDVFVDAREIINRFVGVPVARLTGHYGKQKELVFPEGEEGGKGNNTDKGKEKGNGDGSGGGHGSGKYVVGHN